MYCFDLDAAMKHYKHCFPERHDTVSMFAWFGVVRLIIPTLIKKLSQCKPGLLALNPNPFVEREPLSHVFINNDVMQTLTSH